MSVYKGTTIYKAYDKWCISYNCCTLSFDSIQEAEEFIDEVIFKDDNLN